MMYSSVVLALPQEVAEFTAKAERYVGVTSGGMDQAISIMGMPGIAKLVDFNPVSSIAVHGTAVAVAGCRRQAASRLRSRV
jgi:galactokinase